MGECDGCVLEIFRESKQVRRVASERVTKYIVLVDMRVEQ